MLGTILVRCAFASILISGGAYYFSIRKNQRQYILLARYAYQLAALFILSFCALLIYFILTHQYQYTYVWNYSSSNLPTPLLISTFYAGQEGSFSLWTLYTTIIGVILMHYTAKRNYEPEVMTIWSMILSFLLLMLIVKNPFEFIWNSFPKDLLHTGAIPPDVVSYLWLDKQKSLWAQIPVDGRGLNPLLQNYWMVIHPQILFTGFSSMAVPYTFALAGLMKRDYQSWIKIAKPWTVFGAAVLGTGIILGGYWAYETLGWGGYWGWDPVENSSLIPWLVCVASIHTMMAQLRSGSFIRTNFLLSILCYVMVLYSTFLTRSGVLGETSVHSFVDPGMWAYWLLLGVIILFGSLGIVLLLRRINEMPNIPVEHSMLSREFALLLGAFTICFAAIFVTLGTSSPIITNIFKGKAAAVDTSYYVKTTLPLGIIIALLAGIGQLLWWETSDRKKLFQSMIYPLISSVLFTIGLCIAGVRDIPILIFSFSSAFALFVNLIVGYKIFTGNPKYAGGAIAHIGIALLFLGFVASARYDDKQTLSLEQGKPVNIFNDYTLTYTGNRQIDKERYGFTIDVQHGNDAFTVVPVIRYNEQTNSTMRHPDILNMYTKDFYVSPLSVEASQNDQQLLNFKKGETKEFAGKRITFVDFDFSDVEKGKMATEGSFSIGVILRVDMNHTATTIKPLMKNTGGSVNFIPVSLGDDSTEFLINKLQPNREDPSQSQVTIAIKSPAVSRQQPQRETLVIEATIKPYINLVWMGTITLVVGFIITIVRRVQEAGEKDKRA
jgi:cytochrome c-type biogenesis protein CcmF